MYERGEYKPLSREDAVTRTAAMYKILDDADITIMRVGLKSTDIIGEGGSINGGTYHPAFRQLVEGRIARDEIEPQLDRIVAEIRELRDKSCELIANNLQGRDLVNESFNQQRLSRVKVDVFSSPKWFSNAVGNGGENKKYFEEKYPELSIKFRVDDSLEAAQFRINYDI